MEEGDRDAILLRERIDGVPQPGRLVGPFVEQLGTRGRVGDVGDLGTAQTAPVGEAVAADPVADREDPGREARAGPKVRQRPIGLDPCLLGRVLGVFDVAGGPLRVPLDRAGPWLLGGLIPTFIGFAQILVAMLSGARFGPLPPGSGPVPPPPAGESYDSPRPARPVSPFEELPPPARPPERR